MRFKQLGIVKKLKELVEVIYLVIRSKVYRDRVHYP